MVVVSITIPGELLKKFEKTIKNRGYYSRSEAFRDAVRSFLTESDMLDSEIEKVKATIMIVSDKRKDVTVKLIRITCDLSEIIKETHYKQISEEYCLMIFIAEGTIQSISNLTGKLRGMRGVQQIKTAIIPA